MSERTERHVDQPWTLRDQIVRRQAAAAQGARTITLRKHVGLAHQAAQHLQVPLLAQVELCRQFSVPGVVFLVAEVGQMPRRDLHHIRAVLRQGARAGRPGQHPGQVKHADAGQRAVARRQRLGRAIADPDNFHQRQRGDCRGLWMPRPFRVRPHHAPGAAGGDDRLLQLGGIPRGHRARHRVPVFGHSKHAQGRGAMVGEIAVQIAPAPTFRRIDPHDAVAIGRQLAVSQLHVVAAAQRRGGLAHIHRHILVTPGAQPPQIGRRKPGRGQRRRPGRADAERRRQDRVGAANERYPVRAFGGPVSHRQDGAQGVLRHGRGLHKQRNIERAANFGLQLEEVFDLARKRP